ncbi:MAG: sporulation protein YqfD [Dysosmobacter sp.]
MENKFGAHRGCFGFALNGEDIRNHVLLEIPELSWVAVNVSGCRANVEVRERGRPRKPLDRKIPCNLVGPADGLVLQVQALGASLR